MFKTGIDICCCVLEDCLLLRVSGTGKDQWQFQVCFCVLPVCVPGWEYVYIMLPRFN